MFKNKLKAQLYSGKPAFGTFVATNAPDIVEICGILGFDFVVIDAEHGYISPESALPMIRAAEAKGITPLIRVCENNETLILRNLDIGAHGLHIPQISTAEEASKAVKYIKYYPHGMRGLSFHRACDYGTANINNYMEEANKETLTVFHCENITCIENIDAIAKTPNLDVIIFGPFDMSQSMGIPGDVTNPKVEEAAEKMLQACNRNGKIAGIYCPSVEIAKKRMEQGYLYIPVGVDCKVLADAYKKIIDELKSL